MSTSRLQTRIVIEINATMPRIKGSSRFRLALMKYGAETGQDKNSFDNNGAGDQSRQRGSSQRDDRNDPSAKGMLQNDGGSDRPLARAVRM